MRVLDRQTTDRPLLYIYIYIYIYIATTTYLAWFLSRSVESSDPCWVHTCIVGGGLDPLQTTAPRPPRPVSHSLCPHSKVRSSRRKLYNIQNSNMYVLCATQHQHISTTEYLWVVYYQWVLDSQTNRRTRGRRWRCRRSWCVVCWNRRAVWNVVVVVRFDDVLILLILVWNEDDVGTATSCTISRT